MGGASPAQRRKKIPLCNGDATPTKIFRHDLWHTMMKRTHRIFHRGIGLKVTEGRIFNEFMHILVKSLYRLSRWSKIPKIFPGYCQSAKKNHPLPSHPPHDPPTPMWNRRDCRVRNNFVENTVGAIRELLHRIYV